MGLLGFQHSLKNVPKNKTFLVDTCFIINSLNSNNIEYKVRNKFAGLVGLAYNVIIRKELLHLIRYQLVADAIENKKVFVSQSLISMWKMKPQHERLKGLCDGGYAEIFRKILGQKGEKLEESMSEALTGFSYYSGHKNSNSNDWQNAHSIMAMYGLDSSDAMILNFAIGDATISGIITSDADFRVCGDVKSKNPFDIVLPDKVLLRAVNKEWRGKLS